MKFLCVVMYVFVIVALIGCALGDQDGGERRTETSAGGATACDVELQENQPPSEVPDILMDRMLDCLHEEALAVKRAMNITHNTQEYRNIIKKFCDEAPTVNMCTANVASNVHTCLNETLTATFKVLRNDLETVLNVACEEDGVKIAAILEEIRNQEGGSVLRSTINSCFKGAETNIGHVNVNDAVGTSIALFRLFNSSRTCIAEHGEGQIAANNLIESVLGGIMRKMKCIHPHSHNEVLCESIVEN